MAIQNKAMKRFIRKLNDYLTARRRSIAGLLSKPKPFVELPDSDFIEMAYYVLLRRGADPEGFSFYFDKLQKKQISRDDLVQNLLASNEFVARGDQIPLYRLFLDLISVGSPDTFRPYVKNPPYADTQLNELANPFKWIQSDWRTFAEDLQVVPTSFQGMHRKAFEWVQTLYGATLLGKINSRSVVLGVGTGHEPIVYWMAKHCSKVYATDLFRGEWIHGGAMEGDPSVLMHPEKFQPFEYPKERLTFLPTDGCHLAFKKDSFDLVFSLSSIEHFGGKEYSTLAVKEMERVLKPGGIAVIATEYILNQRNHSEFFNENDLLEYIVKASHMKLIQNISFKVPRLLIEKPLKIPEEIYRTPHMSLTDGGLIWTSIILFFEKPS